MQRAIDHARKLLVGGDGEEHVARFDRDLIVAEAVVFEDPDMVERAFHQRLGARLAIFFEQVLLEAAGIDADADRAAVGLGRGDHFAHALFRADIAWVDPRQAAPASAASSARL